MWNITFGGAKYERDQFSKALKFSFLDMLKSELFCQCKWTKITIMLIETIDKKNIELHTMNA